MTLSRKTSPNLLVSIINLNGKRGGPPNLEMIRESRLSKSGRLIEKYRDSWFTRNRGFRLQFSLTKLQSTGLTLCLCELCHVPRIIIILRPVFALWSQKTNSDLLPSSLIQHLGLGEKNLLNIKRWVCRLNQACRFMTTVSSSQISKWEFKVLQKSCFLLLLSWSS